MQSTSPTSTPKAPKKPRRIRVDPVGAYPVRGPREDRRWYWQATATIAGKRHTVWSGWATRPEAGRAVAEARSALPADLAQAQEPPESATRGLTVADLLDRWLADCAARPQISEYTLRNYRLCAGHVSRLMGAYRLDRVGIQHTQTYLNVRFGEGVRLRTAWGELVVLRVAWRWGAAARLHAEPLHLPGRSSVRLEPVEVAEPTQEEAWAVLDAMQDDGAPLWAVRAYLLVLITGMRPVELVQVQIGDFDLDAGTLVVGRSWQRGVEGTKTGGRRVVLDPDGIALLRSHVEGRDAGERYVGEVRDETVKAKTSRYIRRAAAAVGAPAFSLYGLRHALTNLFYDADAPPEAEAAQLGHSATTARLHYRRVRANRVQAAVLRVAPGRRPEPPRPEPAAEQGEGATIIPIGGRRRSG